MGPQRGAFFEVTLALLIAYGIWSTLSTTPTANADGLLSLSEPSTGPLPGQITIDPSHPQWLMRKGGQHVFICGPGDPEDFLYLGIRSADGTRDGDQVQRIQKLIKYGGNCIYMQIIRTHGGDAKLDTTHNPFVDSKPTRGLDEDILNQWEDWFTLMDRHNILIYLFLYDDGARIWNTGDRVGPEEKDFVATIVQRFKHHKNLIWNVGEESEERYSAARVQAIAKIIKQTDDQNHLIGNHHLSGTTFKAWQPDGAINHYSMQLTGLGEEAHQGAIAALNEAASRYQVIYSESTAALTDIDGARHHAWAVAMGGLMPMFFSMDIASTPAETLQQCRFLQHFFEGTDFYSMSPHDELSEAETKYVLANPGRSYIVYADQLQHTMGLQDVPAGRCLISWLDCQNGRTATEKTRCEQPGNATFKKPAGFGSECAAWIRFPDARPTKAVLRHITVQPTSATHASMNLPPTVSDLKITVLGESKTSFHLQLSDPDGPGPYTYTIVSGPKHGKLGGKNNDRSYTPNAAFRGTDQFTWKVHDGRAESEEATVSITVSTPKDDAALPKNSSLGAESAESPATGQLKRIAGNRRQTSSTSQHTIAKCSDQTPREAGKLRLIIETDAGGDPDDEQSLVRFLLYVNEWDVEGIIATRPETRKDNPNPDPNGLAICHTFIDAYAEVFPTLRTHANGFPTPQYLRERTVAGYNDTDDGVELIIRVVDSPDPRPMWFSNWGTDDETVSSLKRALDRVLTERGPDGYAKFKNKIRLCSDDKFGPHTDAITPHWKFWVYTKMPNMDGGRWYHRFAPLTATAGGFDIDLDVRTDHGPLGPLYAVTADKTGKPQKEGDTPQFLYLIPTGMNDINQPTWGSWAGRYGVRDDSSYEHNLDWYWPNLRDRLDDTFSRDNTLKRWAVHMQNDFKVRMDWCVSTYAAANHPPSPVLQRDCSTEILFIEAKPGEKMTLSAAGSTDPDGDRLCYKWFCYPEAGTFDQRVEIIGEHCERCQVSIPQDAASKTIHMVLVCTDDGSPALTRYRRAVLEVE